MSLDCRLIAASVVVLAAIRIFPSDRLSPCEAAAAELTSIAELSTTRLLERAHRHTVAEEWDRAQGIYRQLLIESPERLFEVAEGRYFSIRDYCWEQLAEMPRESFSRRNSRGASAMRRRFEMAMREDDQRALNEFVGGFFWNPFGEQALDRLGEIHLSHGRFQRAIECWQRLIDLGEPSDVSVAAWKAKAAFASHQSGDDSAVRGVLSSLKLTAPDARATIAGQERLLVEYVESLSEAGDETAARHGDWPMPGGRPSRSATGVPLNGFGRTLWKCETASRPCVSIAEGIVFVLTADELSARDVTTGRLKWKKEWQSKADDFAVAFSPTAADGFVFLPDQGQASAIVAIEAATGKLAMRFAASVPGDGSLVVDGSPVVVDGRVYYSFQATDASTTAHFVRAVDLTTKRLVWQTKICEGPMKGGHVGRPAPLAVLGTVLVAPTGMGLVAALDADNGDFRWAVEYTDTGRRSTGRTSIPPIVTGGVVQVAPVDASLLLGIDIRTGQMRWKTSIGNAATVLPLHDRAVLVVEDSITAVDSLLGKSRWRKDGPTAGMVAPPWSAGRLLLCPCAKHVVTLDSSSGRLRQPVAWPSGAEAGSVVTCQDAVIVCTTSGIRAFANSRL